MVTASKAETGAGQRVPPSAGTPSDPGRLLLSDLLDRQPLLVAINLLVALLAVPVFANAAPFPIVAAWLGVMALIQAGRVVVWRAARHWEIEPARRRLGFWFLTTSTAAGLGWGAARALFGSGASQVASIFVPFVLSGMSAGAVTSLPGYPPAFFAFVWAALLPYAARLAAAPDLGSRVMAGLTLFYAVGVTAVGYQVHRTLRRAAELHLQNAGLVSRLDEARQSLEATVAHRTLELRTAVDSLSREVVERRRSEERVRHLLAHDPLTSLPNRLLLLDRLAQGLARSRRFGTRTAVMALDIDRFKDVNDAFGHPAGDRL
ncbi:MAG TPA: diguanylate cyclase, partial [Geminicoccaceae bacterium]|nr:diguanylate cyclase [Geminicoccaceae bacterium]